MITVYDKITDSWRPQNKQEVMNDYPDLEGFRPCDECWENARDNGVYCWPLNKDPETVKRCKCGRRIA
jgi:hypothetical protein